MKYLLSLRERETGGAVVPGVLLAGEGLGTKDALRVEPAVTVLLHGFNVNALTGRRSLLALADLLRPATNGALIATLWPGDHWIGPVGYSFEGRDADDSAEALEKFLIDNVHHSVTINFVAHSLGCRVALETAKRLLARSRTIGQVCLMAAAVDDDCLSTPDLYAATTKRVERVAVLSSRSDRVLRLAYPVGDLLEAFVFFNGAGLALGYHGPREHEDSGTPVPNGVVDEPVQRRRQVRHSDYLPAPPPSPKQQAAASFAAAVIKRDANPSYG